ncbi:MAG: hypothetical protein K2N52_04065 [Clostridia bacterium]|nr:hypothetical protein [Clostridia bacterium]
MENLHNCENCKFYNKFYYIFAEKLVYTNSGSCKNQLINTNTARKTVKGKLPCEYWEEIDSPAAVQPERLEKAIIKMKQRLDEIYLLLKHD